MMILKIKQGIPEMFGVVILFINDFFQLVYKYNGGF